MYRKKIPYWKLFGGWISGDSVFKFRLELDVYDSSPDCLIHFADFWCFVARDYRSEHWSERFHVFAFAK